MDRYETADPESHQSCSCQVVRYAGKEIKKKHKDRSSGNKRWELSACKWMKEEFERRKEWVHCVQYCG